VLIDATIVRAMLLPATMQLLGDANWYLPSWLGWLPRLGRHPGPGRDHGARGLPSSDAEPPQETAPEAASSAC
jgi:putative drug exporter of the RND superfamily